MPRTGRPKVDNPKNVRIVIRLTEEEYDKVKKSADKNDLSIAETIRKGIRKMLESEQ